MGKNKRIGDCRRSISFYSVFEIEKWLDVRRFTIEVVLKFYKT